MKALREGGVRYVVALTSLGAELAEGTGLIDMTRAFNEGIVKPREGRKPENTTPTRFEDFAGELARAYEAA